MVTNSDAVTVIAAVLSLGGELSVWSCVCVAALIIGVWETVPSAVTTASIVIVSEAPTANVPIVQFGALHVPVDGTTKPCVKPIGSISVTTKLVTIASPLFDTVIV